MRLGALYPLMELGGAEKNSLNWEMQGYAGRMQGESAHQAPQQAACRQPAHSPADLPRHPYRNTLEIGNTPITRE